MVIDWDVHHGNGTQRAFYDREDVYFVSIHQSPLYPGTGHFHERGQGPGDGFTQNIPLPPGVSDGAYTAIFNDIIRPIAHSYNPDLVLVSAGFDAHRDDPLANMSVTDEGFATLCAIVSDIADSHADGRLCLALEGGYNLDALGRSVAACAQILAGSSAPTAKTPDGFDKRVYDMVIKGFKSI